METIRLLGQKRVARGSNYRALTYLVFWIGGRTWKIIGCNVKFHIFTFRLFCCLGSEMRRSKNVLLHYSQLSTRRTPLEPFYRGVL